MSRLRRGKDAPDRGAVAVEFALLLPLLLLILFGIIDFGRALNAQITLTQAAREGARLAALGYTNAEVTSRVTDAAVGVSPVTVTFPQEGTNPSSSAAVCPSGGTVATQDAQVKVSYSFSFVTPLGAIMGIFGGSGIGSPITLSAEGVMPCEY